PRRRRPGDLARPGAAALWRVELGRPCLHGPAYAPPRPRLCNNEPGKVTASRQLARMEQKGRDDRGAGPLPAMRCNNPCGGGSLFGVWLVLCGGLTPRPFGAPGKLASLRT